jgi:transcription elongation factor GreB
MKVIEHLPNDRDRVFFGATVTLESEAGEISSLRIVGSDEFDFKAEYISVDSPMARALLKKQVDDEVYLRLPSGPSTFYINKIEY